MKSFDIQAKKLKGSCDRREKKKEGEKGDRNIRSRNSNIGFYFGQRCSSVESRVISFQFENYNEKKTFRHGFQGDEGDELIDERIIR